MMMMILLASEKVLLGVGASSYKTHATVADVC